MIFLIAESKTMTPCDGAVSPALYRNNTPEYASQADSIMLSLRDLSAGELAARIKISAALASRLRDMIYEFPAKGMGARAIEAFTGVVFKAFDYSTLGEEAGRRADASVRIISSLYGWLRPRDIIKAYRFDFTTRLAPDGGTFAAYWRDAVTDALLAETANSGCPIAVDLMPGDAAKCLDRRRLTGRVRIVRIDFKEMRPGGTLRTPDAGRLKKLRGTLLRQIIEQGAETPDDIRALSSPCYMAEPCDTDPDTIVFTTLPD